MLADYCCPFRFICSNIISDKEIYASHKEDYFLQHFRLQVTIFTAKTTLYTIGSTVIDLYEGI